MKKLMAVFLFLIAAFAVPLAAADKDHDGGSHDRGSDGDHDPPDGPKGGPPKA